MPGKSTSAKRNTRSNRNIYAAAQAAAVAAFKAQQDPKAQEQAPKDNEGKAKDPNGKQPPPPKAPTSQYRTCHVPNPNMDFFIALEKDAKPTQVYGHQQADLPKIDDSKHMCTRLKRKCKNPQCPGRIFDFEVVCRTFACRGACHNRLRGGTCDKLHLLAAPNPAGTPNKYFDLSSPAIDRVQTSLDTKESLAKETKAMARSEQERTSSALKKAQTLAIQTTEYSLSLKNAIQAARDPMMATEKGLRQCKRMATKGRALEYVRGIDKLERIRHHVYEKKKRAATKKRDRSDDEDEHMSPAASPTHTSRAASPKGKADEDDDEDG